MLSAVCWAAFSLFIFQPSPPMALNRAWHSDLPSALVRAESPRRPVMVDFFAEWCPACKEYEVKTFPDERVRSALSGFSLARIDLTTPTEEGDRLQAKYELVGLPSILFLCPNGSELKGTRIEGFKLPDEFLPHLSMIRARFSECK